jgi:hypothetical protein
LKFKAEWISVRERCDLDNGDFIDDETLDDETLDDKFWGNMEI